MPLSWLTLKLAVCHACSLLRIQASCYTSACLAMPRARPRARAVLVLASQPVSAGESSKDMWRKGCLGLGGRMTSGDGNVSELRQGRPVGMAKRGTLERTLLPACRSHQLALHRSCSSQTCSRLGRRDGGPRGVGQLQLASRHIVGKEQRLLPRSRLSSVIRSFLAPCTRCCPIRVSHFSSSLSSSPSPPSRLVHFPMSLPSSPMTITRPLALLSCLHRSFLLCCLAVSQSLPVSRCLSLSLVRSLSRHRPFRPPVQHDARRRPDMEPSLSRVCLSIFFRSLERHERAVEKTGENKREYCTRAGAQRETLSRPGSGRLLYDGLPAARAD